MKISAANLSLITCLLFTATIAHADVLGDAARLLRVTNTSDRYESMALQQTRDIVRTYSSIVSMSVEVALPQSLKNAIADCYARVYAWENFEPGITQLLAENLSQKEILLLIDFYRGRGLPPMEIQTFKDTIAKAEQIQRLSAEYIYANSDSCVDRDASLIFSYLATYE